MKYVIVITGASSGFGALTARALAKAGHTVYASMRDTTARNASQVEEARKFANVNNVDLRTIELDVASQASAVGPGCNDVGASRGHIMDAVEASLRRLQTDHIDLYQIHANDFVTPVEETLRALDTLVAQSKVRYIGVSNWQAWKIARALGISELKNLGRFDTLPAYYSIAGRDL